MKRIFLRILVAFPLAVLIVWLFTGFENTGRKAAYVNVYDWYGMLSKDVIRQFEQETGIHVRYDMYDNNEVLEAKLLASNPGYDVVFPSASPYVARQIAAHVYQPLNKTLLPNLCDLDPLITEKMVKIDAGMVYSIPYYWGTLGIAFDVDKVSALLPGVALDGYHILFDKKNLERLAPCGVSFLEEAVDVFPLVLAYLGRDRHKENIADLDESFRYLLTVRPYIRRFTSSRFINDLVMGDICIAQAWSGESQRAVAEGKSLGRNIRYIIPKEGTTLWIDCIAIPAGAPNPKNAHRFINFLLRPDISAKITNHSSIATAVQKGIPFVKASIRDDVTVFPSQEVMSRLQLDVPQDGSESSLAYDRQRTRAWAKVRLGRE
ncbi:MAG: extracellular solute-binding protein [Alphaproteobacteria bacterium]|nr:extracellular solute-binding protein [Alphaproteobacteria bacterium]